MKIKCLKSLLFASLLILSLFAVLNIKVCTKQGVDYKVSSIRMPLYLKMLDFIDRHYNYCVLVARITDKTNTDEEKVLKLFSWVCNHIKSQPKELPVIDDHVWHIIIRGYGAGEQSSDVFTTLCNYLGMPAFYNWIQSKDDKNRIVLSFVKIDKRWIILDQYRGNIFMAKDGRLASIEDIIEGAWKTKKLSPETVDFDYAPYFCNLKPIHKILVRRSQLQSPLKRLFYQVSAMFKSL